MGIRSQNNPIAAYLDVFSRSGTDASTGAPVGPAGSGLTATGGVISDYTEPNNKVYRSHIFTSSGTFTVSDIPGDFGSNVEYLVVAGGGAGGSGAFRLCGGGGAGGLLSNHPDVPTSSPTGATRQPAYPVSPGSYTVSIGAGGAGAKNGTIVDGSASNFYPTPVSHPHPTYIRALGGGGGGGNPNPGSNGGAGTSGNSGGSGGGNTEGGSGSFTIGGGGSGTTGQGSNGGKTASGLGGGGGGGAGEAGCQDDNGPVPANPPGAYDNGGYGGDGMQVRIAGSPLSDQPAGTPGTNPGGGYFAGGGGGSYQPNTDAPLKGIGGEGGGGYGVIWPGGVNPFGQDGLASTGGGGGGAAAETGPGRGGHGGSGVVVVRYQIGRLTAAQKATGGAVSYYNDKTIHTFTTSGTFTNTSDSDLTVEYVAVAGGGSGGACNGPAFGGGGGAGGVVSNIPGLMPATTAAPVVGQGSPNALTVTVGAGGARLRKANFDKTGNDGTNTTITGPGPWNITAYKGGGGGGNTEAANGGDGSYGSGGGGSESDGAGGAGTPGQGNSGGSGNEGGDRGGGGGGAGEDGNTDGAGQGGDGVRLPSTFHDPASTVGAPGPAGGYYIAGGGGGGSSASTPASGGFGGGGAGASDAVENTGGGGGAQNDPSAGGSGASGLVLIAYPT